MKKLRRIYAAACMLLILIMTLSAAAPAAAAESGGTTAAAETASAADTSADTEQSTPADTTASDDASPSDAAASAPLRDITDLPGLPSPPVTAAPAAILIEAKSGTVLYGKNETEAHFPASITKIMTALLTLEHCSLEETVTFSYRATHELEAGSSSIARTEGEEMSVLNCLYGLLIASANEVAQALAEHVGGSIEGFVEMMNAKAAELGCVNTHFANPSGLNSPDHYTCAYDMALVMAAAIKNPDFVKICSTTNYIIPATNKHADRIGIYMKHELLRGEGKYKYAVCGKTGYTELAKFTLITYAAKDGMDLICVTLACESSDDRAKTSVDLFDYGFDNFRLLNVVENDTSISTSDDAADNGFLGRNLLSLSVSGDSFCLLPNNLSFPQLTSNFSWSSGGRQGEIASIEYSYHGIPVGSARLIVSEDGSDRYSFLREGEMDLSELEAEETRSYIPLYVAAGVLGILVLGFLIFFLRRFRIRHRRRRSRSYSRYLR